MKCTTFAFIGFTLCASLCSAEELDYSQSGIIDDSRAPLYRSRCPVKLSEFVEEASQEKYADVTHVSLRKNSILDPGVENLRDRLWVPGILPELRELDISFNDFTSDGLPTFEALLDRENFQFLNIVGNNSATSIKAEPYFRQLSPQRLEKLILISAKHLDARKWTVLFERRDDQADIIPHVEAIHRGYYAAKKRGILEGLDIPLDVDACNPEQDLLSSTSDVDKLMLQQTYEQVRKGDHEAFNTIGVRYSEGRGIKQDPKKALSWLTHAISLGSVDALFNRGIMLKDMGELEKGIRDITAAAERWHQSAREMLGWHEEKDTSQADLLQTSE